MHAAVLQLLLHTPQCIEQIRSDMFLDRVLYRACMTFSCHPKVLVMIFSTQAKDRFGMVKVYLCFQDGAWPTAR